LMATLAFGLSAKAPAPEARARIATLRAILCISHLKKKV
jgi:hypothetical protein